MYQAVTRLCPNLQSANISYSTQKRLLFKIGYVCKIPWGGRVWPSGRQSMIPGTVKNYIVDENFNRYYFRDDLFYNKISNIICSVQLPDETEFSDHRQDKYSACFQEDVNILSLDCISFNIIQVWYLDVLLIIQIILATFINKSSVKKINNREVFLKTKMKKLYTTYDRLLNILNRKYIGVLQQRNTNEVCAHFHSVTSVFEITSAASATLSLTEAESQLKERATKDLCYYNTFLKKIP